MRIRTIKPEFFKHEGLYELEAATRLPIRIAYAGLWGVADREGRFKWKPRQIKLDVLPYDNIDFAALLDALAVEGFLVKYEIAGELFGSIPNFKKHQVINQREASSVLPGPDGEGVTLFRSASMCMHVQACESANIAPELRDTVLARDGHKCVRCGAVDDLAIDHIFPKSIGGTTVLPNLRSLCKPCNSARPVAGEALIADLLRDGLTMDDMLSRCMHVQAHGEGKGREGKGKEVEQEMFGPVHAPAKARKGRAESVEEVIEFMRTIDLQDSDGQWFWDKMLGCGWKNGKNPVHDWKATIRAWKAANYIPSQKQNQTYPPGAEAQIAELVAKLNNHPAKLAQQEGRTPSDNETQDFYRLSGKLNELKSKRGPRRS